MNEMQKQAIASFTPEQAEMFQWFEWGVAGVTARDGKWIVYTTYSSAVFDVDPSALLGPITSYVIS